ncbi:MAG TPA: SMC-Scp complex subunit ScpB [Anaerolineae bacterium]|nr:SMC-Scp complex subunit ScpB [Anaerolineae bacterium]HRA19554.1 SMC-Scp complex subunit ScpB [Anaerolineae bacterium]
MAIMTQEGRRRVRAGKPDTAAEDLPLAGASPAGADPLEGAEFLLWDADRKVASLPMLLESLLFVADQPVAVGDLARVLDLPRPAVERALKELDHSLAGRGLRLQRVGSQVQLVTAPEAAAFIQRFLGLESTARLSRAALETLSIIAYRQPATRPEIEALRGVNAEGAVRTLLARGLVAPLGRRDTVGQPVEYGTTFQFLEYFGIGGLHELPPLERGRAADEAPAEVSDLPGAAAVIAVEHDLAEVIEAGSASAPAAAAAGA